MWRVAQLGRKETFSSTRLTRCDRMHCTCLLKWHCKNKYGLGSAPPGLGRWDPRSSVNTVYHPRAAMTPERDRALDNAAAALPTSAGAGEAREGGSCAKPAAAASSPGACGAATTAYNDTSSSSQYRCPESEIGAARGPKFLQAAQMAWSHLSSKCRLSIRGCCREGRELHDRLWTDVRVRFAASQGTRAARALQVPRSRPAAAAAATGATAVQYDTRGKDPDELGRELEAAVARGARPRSLAVHFGTLHGVNRGRLRKQQLLSVLSCCAPRCGPGLTHLELSGCPPLTPAVAQAVAEAAPGLKSLTISFSSRVELQRPRKKADLTAYERFLLYLQFQLRWPWQRGRWQAIQYFAAQHLSEVRWEPWTAAGAHQPPPWDLPEGQGDQPFEALPPAHTGAGGSGLTLYGTGGAGGGPAAAGSPVGFLATCGGGRLQRLRLLRAGRWLPGSFAALEACSRLTELEVSLTGSTWPYGFAEESAMLDCICRLPSLQALSLHHQWRGTHPAYTAVQLLPYATCLQRLGALTALRRLRLCLPHRCRRDVLRSELQPLLQFHEEELPTCVEAWDSQQAALAAALRCMPHLQSLTYDAGFLGANDLAGCTALTHLKARGLLLPTLGWEAAGVGRVQAGGLEVDAPTPPLTEQGVAYGSAYVVQLPPQLQELRLDYGASPQVVAAVARLQALRRVAFFVAGEARLVWFASDAWWCSEEGVSSLRSEAASCVGEAARVLALAQQQHPTGNWRKRLPKCLAVSAELLYALLPPEGGHAVWIRQLAPLGDTRELQLSMLHLRPGDLMAISKTFPELRRLDLSMSCFPMAALPCLAPLPKLHTLRFAPYHCCDATLPDTLASALLLACMRLPELDELVVKTQGMEFDVWPVWGEVQELLPPWGKNIELVVED